MSGHKRATISIQQVDPRRLEEAAARLQNVEKDFQAIRERINQLHTDQIQSDFHQMQARQDHFTQSLGYLDDHLQAIEINTSQALVQAAKQFNINLTHVGSNLWQDTASLLEKQAQSIQTVLDASFTAQQAQFLRLQKAIAKTRASEAFKQETATQAFNSACALLNSFDAAYNPGEVLPGVIEQLSMDLEQTHQNLSNGFYEAGLLASQQIYQRCSAARLEIENHILQQQLAYDSALVKAHELLARLDYIRQVHAVDLDGNPLDESIDVEYWSWGTWKQLGKEGKRILNLLEQSKDQVQLEQIALILQQLDHLDQQLPSLVSQARQNILSSQVRYNLAECIVQALQEQGFFLVDSDYQNGDQRLPYQTRLQNLSGSEILVQLAPQEECPILHTIDLISTDANVRTEHELQQRAKALKSTLQAYGLDISTFAKTSESSSFAPLPMRAKQSSHRQNRIQSQFH